MGFAGWSLLLRPSEREEPTKVGQFDDTILLDNRDFPDLGALFAGLRSGDPEVWLFSFSQTQLLHRFQSACRAAGMGSLNLEMYQMRHGGASKDFLMKALIPLHKVITMNKRGPQVLRQIGHPRALPRPGPSKHGSG